MTWPATGGAPSDLDQGIADSQARIAGPARVTAATAPVAEVATQTVVGSCARDGRVSVTVTGAGQVVDVRVSPDALRELDRVTLAGYLVEATNHALDRGEELLADAAEPAPPGDIEAVMDRFARRMNELLVDLERITSNLDAIRTT